MFHFDKKVERKGTNCLKWDMPGENFKEDITPLWIADMDFCVSPFIMEEMKKVFNRELFGYHYTTQAYQLAVIHWLEKRHQFKVEEEEICPLLNVISGLSLGVEAVSEPGDEIIIQTPVYGPFYRVVKENKRILVENPLIEENGSYRMDFTDLEKKITKKTKALILCNPHNPCGRVWRKEELETLAEICNRYQLYLISDEIHFDLVRRGQKHTMIAALSDELRERCITLTSPSKTFNIAGLHVANAIIKEKELRTRFLEPLNRLALQESNAFAEAAVIGAYEKSEQWLEELLDYLDENIDYFVSYCKKYIKELQVEKPEGTYLVWVNCKKLAMNQKELTTFFLEKCKVYISDGTLFGENGEGYVRFNLACPREILTTVLDKMRQEINLLNVAK